MGGDESDPRVPLAYSRTHLANERTYAAWLRTGLAIAAAGYVLIEFVTLSNADALVAIGSLMVATGAGVIVFGAWSFHRVHRSLSAAGAAPTPLALWMVHLVSTLLTVLLAGTLLFL